MRKLICSLLVFGGLMYLAVYFAFSAVPVMAPAVNVNMSVKDGSSQSDVFGFVVNRLLQEDGSIRTNLNGSAAGDDILSESVGLIMEDCVITGNKPLFDKELSFLRNRLLTGQNLVRWRVGGSDADCNAAIDDLRIAGALLNAGERWGDRTYLDLAGFMQEGLYNLQVEDGELYQFYDWKSKRCRKSIPLCYLDLYTLERLSKFNRNWKEVEDRSAFILRQGQIKDSLPFYFKIYDYETGRYLQDEGEEKGDGICLTYTLYTALHLLEVNEETPLLLSWLKGEMKKGRLYAWVDPVSGKPVSKMESTAVYALAAVYARKAGEPELCRRLLARMAEFQVRDKVSEYWGGFGNPGKHSFYSFDNLTALWAIDLASARENSSLFGQ